MLLKFSHILISTDKQIRITHKTKLEKNMIKIQKFDL